MLTFSSTAVMADLYHRRGRPLCMASRYVPKADLYMKVCSVIIREDKRIERLVVGVADGPACGFVLYRKLVGRQDLRDLGGG